MNILCYDRPIEEIINTPQLGDRVSGKYLGHKDLSIYTWRDCPDCGKLHWVARRNSGRCHTCAGIRKRKWTTILNINTPQLGDVAYCRDIGIKEKRGYYKYTVCSRCGKSFWLTMSSRAKDKVCSPCRKLEVYKKRPIEEVLRSPIIGDAIYGRDIGRCSDKSLYIWVECEHCGYTRWVRNSYRYQNSSHLCHRCAKFNANRVVIRIGNEDRVVFTNSNGYLGTTLLPNDKFTKMASRRRQILVHRLVMAVSLGRCLESWEVVHHINRNRQDNRIENLELASCPHHSSYNLMQYEIDKLRSTVEGLQNKIKLAEWRIRELENLGGNKRGEEDGQDNSNTETKIGEGDSLQDTRQRGKR